MHGLRQNLRIQEGMRRFHSNRLCRYQQESFKRKKKISRWWRRQICPRPPSKNENNGNKTKRRKNFRRPKLVSRILQGLGRRPLA